MHKTQPQEVKKYQGYAQGSAIEQNRFLASYLKFSLFVRLGAGIGAKFARPMTSLGQLELMSLKNLAAVAGDVH